MRIVPLFVLVCLVFLSACGIDTNARSAKVFVENYSKAWKAKDIDAIVAMQAKNTLLEKAGINEELTARIKEYNEAENRKEIENSLKARDVWAKAWENTRYESEEKKDGYIRVKVRVKGAVSVIVLVEEDGALRLHPNPSLFN